MLAQERRGLILEDLRVWGGIETDEIAKRYGVSVETVRRDLLELEKRSLLKRVYGGAVRVSASTEPPHSERENVAASEKLRIADRVVTLIPDDSTVFLDLGTTVEALARAIPRTFSGTIITASLRAVATLAHLPHADIIVSGGKLRKSELSLSGSMATSFLDSLYPEIAIISTGAIDARAGVTDFDFDEMHVKKAVLANSTMSIIVADSSKIGRIAPYRLCGVEAPSYIATNAGLPADHMTTLQESGAHLLLA
ncbi:DeoR family transcriptional regulator [Flaviflexus huanghaiensis]|uniref:DeoR family transcriptional regulator n=1 Tax=Flaviflexus huanghaiensis TaxID=1111473 RepID=UPI0015FC2EBF